MHGLGLTAAAHSQAAASFEDFLLAGNVEGIQAMQPGGLPESFTAMLGDIGDFDFDTGLFQADDLNAFAFDGSQSLANLGYDNGLPVFQGVGDPFTFDASGNLSLGVVNNTEILAPTPQRAGQVSNLINTFGGEGSFSVGQQQDASELNLDYAATSQAPAATAGPLASGQQDAATFEQQVPVVDEDPGMLEWYDEQEAEYAATVPDYIALPFEYLPDEMKEWKRSEYRQLTGN